MTTHLTETQPIPPADLDDDDLFAVPDRPRVGRLTALLVMGIVACAAWTGGVLVQKHHDANAGTTSTAALLSGLRNRAAAGGFGGEGFGAGGFGGAGTSGAQGQGTGSGFTGTGTGAGTGGGTTATAGPAVVGQVVSVSGNTLTVKNFAGKTIKVTVPTGTEVSSTVPLASLAAGTSVSVSGTAAADGSVTATAVTARKS